MSTPLAITLVSGYLGSGKTTLINHLLRHANGERLAILVNDFGDLPIDAELIEAQGDDVISLTGGCVCCAYGNDLSTALLKLQSQADLPDQVFVEASGVALPAAIAQSLTLLRSYSLRGVVTLLCADTFMSNVSNVYMKDTIEQQLHSADLILLNKVDLVSESRLKAVRQWCASTLPNIGIVETVNADIAPELFLDRHDRPESIAKLRNEFADVNQTGNGAPVSIMRDAPLKISNAAHVAAIETFSIVEKQAVDASKLAAGLRTCTNGLVRAKGFVPDLDGQLKTLQLVGARVSISSAPENALPGLVCIGMKDQLDKDALMRLYASCLGA